jgi:hypothetical protein
VLVGEDEVSPNGGVVGLGDVDRGHAANASGPSRDVPPEIGDRRSPPCVVLDHLKSQRDSCGSAS